MNKRRQNERKFRNWEDLPDGGRRYWYEKAGFHGRKARYVKIVDKNENTISFQQEICNEQGIVVEIHKKYPTDEGHRPVRKNK